MEKNELCLLLEDGLSYREISKKYNCSPKKVEYWVNKHNLKFKSKFNKEYQNNVDHNLFNKIDTKEKAYICGFILGDGEINNNYDVHLGVALNDKEIIENISDYIPWEIKISIDKTFNKKNRRFPRARMCIRSRKIGKDLIKHFSDRLASKRRVPIVSKKFEKYLIAGFFDADGCITWGYRKDRNRLWHKVSFTASDSILTGIQKILYKNEISTIIRPKKNENVYLIEFSNKEDIIKFHKYLPVNGIRLKRKVDKYNQLIKKFTPLRLESDENGENI